MCGLVGFVGPNTRQNMKVLENLLIMDTLRGAHSTGVLGITRENKYSLSKKAVDGLSYVAYGELKPLDDVNARVYIGHNRFATQGAINETNAHPFLCGLIGGAHNGTLINQHLLPNSRQFEVDSENIFYAINKEGIEETWKKIDGAAALTYWDFRSKKLNLIRNNNGAGFKPRPLHYVINKSGHMFWASEKFMLVAALERNGVAYVHSDIVSLEPDTLYTFDVEMSGAARINGKPTAKRLEAYSPPKKNWKTVRTTGNCYDPQHSSSSSNVVPFEGRKVDRKLSMYDLSFFKDKGISEEDTLFFIAEKVKHRKVIGKVIGKGDLKIIVDCKSKAEATSIQEHDGYHSVFKLTGFSSPDRNYPEGFVRTTASDIVGWDDVTKSGVKNMIEKSGEEATERSLNAFPSDEDDNPGNGYYDFSGKQITREEWSRRYNHCIMCYEEIDPDIDGEDLVLVDHDHALCGSAECYNQYKEIYPN